MRIEYDAENNVMYIEADVTDMQMLMQAIAFLYVHFKEDDWYKEWDREYHKAFNSIPEGLRADKEQEKAYIATVNENFTPLGIRVVR